MFAVTIEPGGCTQRQDPRQPRAECGQFSARTSAGWLRTGCTLGVTQCHLQLSSAGMAQKRAYVLFSAAHASVVSMNAVMNIQTS